MSEIKKGYILSTVFFISALLVLTSCAELKRSRPLVQIKEYERLIAGRLDADYVGTKACLSACHSHDRIKRAFDASTMGAQLKRDSGMPLVDCESCHGPGSLAIKGITKKLVEENLKKGIKTSCNYKTLIDIKNLPAPAKSLICLKCHTANATFNLHQWNTGIHTLNDVSCIDCHSIHAGADLKVRPTDTASMCFKCHEDIKTYYSMPSHHPVSEKKLFCTDCHNPHGTATEHLLKGETVRKTCTRCHGEKEGPYLYEHGDLTEECTTCHLPHGSPNNNLLRLREPFLCLQCHEGHAINSPTSSSLSYEAKAYYFTRCTDCHSMIHGTDTPSPGGKGRFIQ
ncbi:MAG: DmsE family decaheme c-type cytochrome [Nitrospirae bacterium]|nr:MAG: DmsE family decaheme c-type cytochrome [Nitrospirota bacterium]